MISLWFHLYSTFYNKNCLQVLPRGRNPEPEPPGQHSGQEKPPLTGGNLEQDRVHKTAQAGCYKKQMQALTVDH